MTQKQGVAQSTLKKLDIFSLPFKFNLGDEEKDKKTAFGGLSSLIIVILSIMYFAYLCQLYFANKIQPAIASSNEFSSEDFGMVVEQNFIAIQIKTKDGLSIFDFEKKQGKKYLNLISQYTYGSEKSYNIEKPLIPCQDESLIDYMCFDLKSFSSDENFNLLFDAKEREKYTLTLFISICDQQYLSNGEVCENTQVIRDTIITYATDITVRLGLQQFNTKTKKLENRIKEEFFFFDENLAFYTKFNLQKTDLKQNEGFIIQYTEESRYFSDYIRKDISSSQTYLAKQMERNVIGGLVFFIGQEGVDLQIQYPQFTTLLAQFTSVFNSLMFIGIFCKIFAQTEIVQSFADLQLKTYFKQTAVQLVEEVCEKAEVKQAKQDGTIGLWNYIQKMDFKSIGKRLNISILQKLKFILMPSKKDNKQKESKQHQIFKQLIDSSNKSINIFEVNKEIIQLKIMLRLLLSVEQFAAMQLCGSKVPGSQMLEKEKIQDLEQIAQSSDGSKRYDIETPNKQKETKTSIRKVNTKQFLSVCPIDQIDQEEQDLQKQQINYGDIMNHLEKIDRIERDQNYFQKSVNQFLKNNSSSTDDLNKRIMGCMIGIEQSQSLILDHDKNL